VISGPIVAIAITAVGTHGVGRFRGFVGHTVGAGPVRSVVGNITNRGRRSTLRWLTALFGPGSIAAI
jgi:hypothetical protein